MDGELTNRPELFPTCIYHASRANNKRERLEMAHHYNFNTVSGFHVSPKETHDV